MEDNKSVKTLSTLGIAMTIIMPFIIGALGLEQSSLIATAQSREITLHGKGSGTWSYQLGTLHKDAKVIVKITDALTYTGDHFYAFVLETNSSSQRWQSDWVDLRTSTKTQFIIPHQSEYMLVVTMSVKGPTLTYTGEAPQFYKGVVTIIG